MVGRQKASQVAGAPTTRALDPPLSLILNLPVLFYM